MRPVVVTPILARYPSSPLGGGGSAREVAYQLQGSRWNRWKQAPRIDHQDRGPDVLTGIAKGPKIRAGAGDVKLGPTNAQPHPILRGPSNSRDDFAGSGRVQCHPPLGEIRLTARADRVAEDPRYFLGDPHHLFPNSARSFRSQADRIITGARVFLAIPFHLDVIKRRTKHARRLGSSPLRIVFENKPLPLPTQPKRDP